MRTRSPRGLAALVLLAALSFSLACGDDAPDAPSPVEAGSLDAPDTPLPIATEVEVFATHTPFDPATDSLFLGVTVAGGGSNRYGDPHVEPNHAITWEPYSDGTLYVRFTGYWPFRSRPPADSTFAIAGTARTQTLAATVNASCPDDDGMVEPDCIAYTAWVWREAEGDSITVHGGRTGTGELRTRPRIIIDRPPNPGPVD
ncbi:MAG: hypothetical protein R3181_06590 [Rubricoccaceae bacterium]|nr:hypothetical protein [Rubricoccaceae bacterium]